MKQPATSESDQTAPLAKPPASAELDTATLKLLAQWRRDDATDDPEQIRFAERELAEFKNTLNEWRTETGEPILYP